MSINNWKKEIFTVPNVLSLFRLVLIPVYILIYTKATRTGELSDYYLSAGILAVSCLTDMIDGKIARHFNMITTVGKILDPLADKITQFSMIVCLAMRYPVLTYLIVLFVIKEVFQLVMGGFTLLKKHKMLEGALLAGKICTTVLFVSLILMVMVPTLSYEAVTVITVIDIIFVAISFIQYILAYFGKNKKVRDV